ncbi:FHA domain-containing protein [Verrucomicrobium sp. BvORR106]|uniref:FHA domain-containing protein n=1 Tax=Verrucomicrobium sp. BvORR106 TaxID=1403819 RepID=UPI00056E0AA7|nr:FHA domain-containing protein [Verrucomicrobium sp. BvORR106]
MSDTRSQWLLKVIAGPHQGAEIDLAPGKSLIGSDEGCDVVLHDVLIAPQHVAIDAGPKALFVEPLGGRVYLAGKRVKDTRQKVEPFVFITLGGTHLVIGPVDGKWPLLSAGDAPELEKEAPEPPPGEEGKPADNAAAAAGATAGNGGGSAAAAATDGESPPPPKRAVAIFGVAFGLLLLTAWLILFNIWKGNNPLPGGDGDNDLKSRAEAVLKVHGASEDVRVESDGGRLYARGYVPKSDQLRDIEVDLRTKASGVVPRIWSLESLGESARSILRQQRLPLDVIANAEGRLVVSGSVTDRDLWNRVKQQLTDEIPGVTGVEAQVTVPSIMKPTERTVIVTLPAHAAAQKPSGTETTGAPAKGAGNGVAAAATITPAAGLAAASAEHRASQSQREPAMTSGRGSMGITSAPQEEKEKGVGATGSGSVNAAASATGLFQAPPPVPRALFPTIDKPDATVESIQNRPGGLGSMRLSSGGIYFAGARLPFGGVIKQVSEGRIVIQEGESERVVGIGDMVILGAPSGAASKEAVVDIATVSDALRDSGVTAEAVSVRRALPAEAPVLPAIAPQEPVKEAAPSAIEPPLPVIGSPPTGEPAPGPVQTKAVSSPPPADFQKPVSSERQKAIQEALEAAVASESAKPHSNKSPVASSGQKQSKP